MSAAPKFYTLEEVAGIFRHSKRTVERWIVKKKLEAFSLDRTVLVREGALAEFVLAHTLLARKPDWLTPEIEQLFEQKVESIAVRAVKAEFEKAKSGKAESENRQAA